MTHQHDVAAIAALADRVEAARGPDRALDALIAHTVGHAQLRNGTLYAWCAAGSTNELVRAPAYTASLDAAMTLVPEGLECLPLSFKVEHFYLGSGIWQSRASVWDGLGGVSSLDTASVAATPALTLTAAALRARAHLGASHER